MGRFLNRHRGKTVQLKRDVCVCIYTSLYRHVVIFVNNIYLDHWDNFSSLEVNLGCFSMSIMILSSLNRNRFCEV